MKLEMPTTPHADVAGTAECDRLGRAEQDGWRDWGPYLSARQWGTVREDYSADGSAWTYLPHDHARSRAYRWGEDGIGGFAHKSLNICIAPAFWNGADPILKERLFGLTNAEGNHGEDVKELYYYLDALPSHAYMRMLYKYPQRAFPYRDLVETNAKRGLKDPEYELLDTGVFNDDAYFDIEIEYAKAASDDILMRVTARNRGAVAAPLHILPQIWARNIWSWNDETTKPHFEALGPSGVRVLHPDMPALHASLPDADDILFCDNETNVARLFGQQIHGHFKDAVNDCVVDGRRDAVNPLKVGTKAAGVSAFTIAPGESAVVRLRLRREDAAPPLQEFDAVFEARRLECDAYYSALQTRVTDADARNVQRQALASLLWSKQFYEFDVRKWLIGDPGQPAPPPERQTGRDNDWPHVSLCDVMSMPDTWEYPWFASWDLAFHCVALAPIDPGYAKSQLALLTQSRSQHPRGQLPAYEWKFSDANPPVQAWAALKVFEIDRDRSGVPDRAFLERVFQKLTLNFTWWVNREDASGRNLFQGGFLGLDNIGVFDRSDNMDGTSIDQSDGTAWVAMYALNLMNIALELAMENHVYEDMAIKFFEHFLYIAQAMHGSSEEDKTDLWDDEDGFYYDVYHAEGDETRPMRVRSVVGLIPLMAVGLLNDEMIEKLPDFRARMIWFLQNRSDLAALVSHFSDQNKHEMRLLSIMRRDRMNRVLARMLDQNEFLSDFGVRSLSKIYQKNPYEFAIGDMSASISYEPGEGETRTYGGNSNWRGPIWMPINFLIIDSLRKFQAFYGNDHKLAFPTGSADLLSLGEIADRLSARLCAIFLRQDGRRPLYGQSATEQNGAEFRDHILFHEYFHGENGRGLGASHQTGWTALIALLLGGLTDSSKTEVEKSQTEGTSSNE